VVYFTRAPKAEDVSVSFLYLIESSPCVLKKGCGHCNLSTLEWNKFEIIQPEMEVTTLSLRARAAAYEAEKGSAQNAAEINKLQQTHTIKGDSPLLHVPGFDPVWERGLDALHQCCLGPVKETMKKSFSKSISSKNHRVKTPSKLSSTHRTSTTFSCLSPRYIFLIYRVDGKNVAEWSMEWSMEARGMAQQLFEFKENDTTRYGQIERRVISRLLSPFTTLMHTPLTLIRL